MLDAHSVWCCGPWSVGQEKPEGGGAGWEIWIEGRRVWAIISWTSNNKPTAPFLLGSWTRRPVSTVVRNGTAKRGRSIPHERWTGAVHLVLELDAYTVSGGHDGCIWPPFPVTALSGRRAKFDLCRPALHDSLGLPESSALGPTNLLSARLCGGAGIVECFSSVLTPRESCHAGERTNLVIRTSRAWPRDTRGKQSRLSGPGSKRNPIWCIVTQSVATPARQAGLAGVLPSSNLLHTKHSARLLGQSQKADGRREALYISAGVASSIASPCRRPGLGTRQHLAGVRLPLPPEIEPSAIRGRAGWMLRPGAQIAQVPRQMGWLLQDSAPMRHSLADLEGNASTGWEQLSRPTVAESQIV